MKILLAFLIVLAGGIQPAIVAAQTGPETTASEEVYRLASGDELRLTIYGLDSATGTYVIGDGGRFSIPLVGTIEADGKTVAELEASIAETLKAKQILKDPSVTAQVVKYRPFYILGEVQRPGQYPYAPGMTVLQAVSVAGGYTFRANERKATIQRKSGTTSGKLTAKPDSLVRPGDTIIIPEAWF